MSQSKCKVIIIGNLGADPEIRYTQNSTPIANLSVATSERWKDKQTGEQREQTEWHRIVCYRKVAEIAGNYLRKGSKVYLEGRLQTRKWQGQDGKDNYTTEIVCNELIALDSNSNTNSGQRAGQGQQSGQNGGHPGPQQGGFAGQPAPQQGGFGGQQGGPPAQQQGGFGGQQGGQSAPQQGGPQGGQPPQQRGYGSRGGY